jgi:opacity protein-like surface antigen
MSDGGNHNKIALVESSGGASLVRKGSLVGGVTLAAMLMSSPAALAETCSALASPIGNLTNPTGFAASVASNATAAITTASTAFLLQTTAFVSGPNNPGPDQQGSGVWARAVGGVVNLQSPSTSAVAFTVPASPASNTSGVINCSTETRQDFVGIQVGHDVAKLNLDGWNIHLGTTAGYLEARNTTVGGNFLGGAFTSTVQTPFAGTYIAVSKGRFFADALLRFESYELNLNSPSLNIFNQNLNARGVSFTASAGYNWLIPNSQWFIEPSVGIVVSRTSVDPFVTAGAPLAPPNTGIQGTLQINDIKSVIGRAGFRVGTTVAQGDLIWSPFVAASVWHEFGDAPTASYAACGNCIFLQPPVGPNLPATLTSAFVGSTVGTYGQYSVGTSLQVANTGWVAFARGDYRDGNRLDGWSGTGGVRYHFTPEIARAPVIGKGPVLKAPPMVVAHNWTGWYVGGSVGAAFQRSRMDFVNGMSSDPRGAGFIGGVQAGYNYQFSPQWVAGIEGGWDWTNLNGARACSPLLAQAGALGGAGQPPLQNTTCNAGADWVATLTGRLGYVWGRALWYGKAGAAWAHETFNVTCNLNIATQGTCLNPAGGALVSAGASNDRFGWLVGYGLEYAMTSKWTARAESTFMGFGNHSLTLNDGTVVNTRMHILTTKIGVNYKLF